MASPKLVQLLCLLLLISSFSLAQPNKVSGKVEDSETGQALAFVNIVINNSNRGGVSDIDGRFNLVSSEPIKFLRFSSVGYDPFVQTMGNDGKNLDIRLKRIAVALPELLVVAGENPAHRIIENAITNRDRNNYEKLPSFSYTSYDKMIFTVNPDSLRRNDTLPADSSFLRLKEFVDKQHLFIFETVSKRRFLYPGRDHQQVVASRVSGFKDPIFVFMLSQLQSTSFYNDIISISDKNYINPISGGSTSRYFFNIDDTLFIAGSADTTFIISYRPRINTNFDGLKGVIHINSNRWAIQNVVAQPSREEKGVSIRIQQMYALIDSLYWFPVQLNTDLVMKQVSVNNFPPIGQGRSYITDIVVNPKLVRRMFNEINVEVNPNAIHRSDEEWNQWRNIELDDKDLRTYSLLDSIGKARNFDRFATITEALISREVPIGKINLTLDKIARYNLFEKIYLGMGFNTNPRLSSFYKAGAWVGYGFGDKKMKYGTDVSLKLSRHRDARWYFCYANDITETGAIDPFVQQPLLRLDDFRSYLIRQMDYTKTLATGIHYRLLPYVMTHVELDRSFKAPGYDYFYTTTGETFFPKAYVFTNLSLGVRFAWREKILQTTRSRISMGSKYPVFWVRYTHGLKGFLDGRFSYNRLDAKMEHSVFTRFLGKTSVLIRAGIIMDEVPYMQLYSGFASHGQFTLHTAGSFATMRMNEFVADRYVSIFLTHDFGKLLLRTKRFEPGFVISTHAGFGWLKNQTAGHHSIAMSDFPKGYFESGLLVNNLLSFRFFNMGLGAFYRYGRYALDGVRNNTSLKITVNYPF